MKRKSLGLKEEEEAEEEEGEEKVEVVARATVGFPHKEGELGLQQRASLVIQIEPPKLPLTVTVQGIDITTREELKLCSKVKKDHTCVIKTLNLELFPGGAKADITFYCKGSKGGCNTKRPSEVRLYVVTELDDSVVTCFSSPFLVRGNRRQTGQKGGRYKCSFDSDSSGIPTDVTPLGYSPSPSISLSHGPGPPLDRVNAGYLSQENVFGFDPSEPPSGSPSISPTNSPLPPRNNEASQSPNFQLDPTRQLPFPRPSFTSYPLAPVSPSPQYPTMLLNSTISTPLPSPLTASPFPLATTSPFPLATSPPSLATSSPSPFPLATTSPSPLATTSPSPLATTSPVVPHNVAPTPLLLPPERKKKMSINYLINPNKTNPDK